MDRLDLESRVSSSDHTSLDCEHEIENSSSDHASLQHSYRTLEEVTQSADAAGLSNSLGSVQLLHFSSQLHSEEIRIMELEEPVLSALRRGEKYVSHQKHAMSLPLPPLSIHLLTLLSSPFPLHPFSFPSLASQSLWFLPQHRCTASPYTQNEVMLRRESRPLYCVSMCGDAIYTCRGIKAAG